MRRGVLDSPASRLSAGCSASELTARPPLACGVDCTSSMRQAGLEVSNLRVLSAALWPIELQARYLSATTGLACEARRNAPRPSCFQSLRETLSQLLPGFRKC